MFYEESYSASPHDLALLVIVTLNQINSKKNKIDKDNFEKIIREKKSCKETL